MTPPDPSPVDFSLIETLRRDPDGSFVRLELHLARLGRSAARFAFPGAGDVIDRAQAELAALAPTATSMRVRLELFADGRLSLAATPFAALPPGTVWRAAIARTRLESSNPLLAHKTSMREAYQEARAEYPAGEADEVLLLNERGEVSEGTITTVFVDDGAGTLLTPPLSAGLLAGVLRQALLKEMRAREAPLLPRDLEAKTFYLGNSLRGLIPARLA